MKNVGLYYLGVLLFIFISQLTPWGAQLFQPPKIKNVTFPQTGEIFDPGLPLLPSGVRPEFPSAEIILQENLFAPFVDMQEQNLSKKNLSKSHLSFADLRKADLRGANLSQALLYGARLEGALFDSTTILPFSRETALALGMKSQ